MKTKSFVFVLGAAAVMSGATFANAAIVLNETFTYPNGPLVTAAGSPWTTHSGTANQVDVSSNAVNLTSTESEDVNAPLVGAPYTTGTLYAGADVNFSVLPTAAAGTYFIHFKDATTSGFRGRVFASTTGAAAGTFRVGIADTTTTIANIPTDLSLNTTYRLVEAINTATGRTTLYLNATTETGGVTATDATTALAISTYALRQATNYGTLKLDNLIVATTFAEAAAVPEPTTFVGLVGLAGMTLLRRRAKRA